MNDADHFRWLLILIEGSKRVACGDDQVVIKSCWWQVKVESCDELLRRCFLGVVLKWVSSELLLGLVGDGQDLIRPFIEPGGKSSWGWGRLRLQLVAHWLSAVGARVEAPKMGERERGSDDRWCGEVLPLLLGRLGNFGGFW